ncbi:RES domain-containing protein [Rhizobium mongolense subsp. loessense]|uniref:RES domain-containing protein n=1 Tax=Rhizobium mongolense subsp. loessense TaxID=158890 RepID=A0A1G4S4Q3_9HYPH|nr:RES domain-containing protein [Rhizobium mongolense subsp. loessense]
MIYSTEHYSTAVLEKLVHGSGRLPPSQHYVEIIIPRGLTYEVFSPPTLSGWDAMPATVSKKFGEQWCLERRSTILLVPSVVARLDPAHPEFPQIRASLHQPVYWDRRLFGA